MQSAGKHVGKAVDQARREILDEEQLWHGSQGCVTRARRSLSAAYARQARISSWLTLPRLKPGGSGSPPATCGPCPGRYSDRAEIRDGVRLDLAVDAIHRFGADVARPIHVPVDP